MFIPTLWRKGGSGNGHYGGNAESIWTSGKPWASDGQTFEQQVARIENNRSKNED